MSPRKPVRPMRARPEINRHDRGARSGRDADRVPLLGGSARKRRRRLPQQRCMRNDAHCRSEERRPGRQGACARPVEGLEVGVRTSVIPGLQTSLSPMPAFATTTRIASACELQDRSRVSVRLPWHSTISARGSALCSSAISDRDR